jgi:hypothetical protein
VHKKLKIKNKGSTVPQRYMGAGGGINSPFLTSALDAG